MASSSTVDTIREFEVGDEDDGDIASTSTSDVHRQSFNNELKECLEKKSKSILFTKERYDQLVQELITAFEKQDSNRTKKEERLCQQFDLLRTDRAGVRLVTKHGDVDSSNLKRYVHCDELFPILNRVHLNLNHGTRTKMREYLSRFYENITLESINIYCKHCQHCQVMNRQHRMNNLKKYPKIFKKPLMKWKIEIIDMTDYPDEEYEYILHYSDVETKFAILKPLKDGHPDSVSKQLKSIFGWIGAPHVLTSSLGQDYVHDVVKHLLEYYPKLKVIVDKTPDVEEEEKQEPDKGNEIRNLLKIYHKSFWSDVLEELQFVINSVVSNGKKKSPFEEFFGRTPQFGLNIDFEIPKNYGNQELIADKLEEYCRVHLGSEKFDLKTKPKKLVDFRDLNDSFGSLFDTEDDDEDVSETDDETEQSCTKANSSAHQSSSSAIFCRCIKENCLTKKCTCRSLGVKCNAKCHTINICKN